VGETLRRGPGGRAGPVSPTAARGVQELLQFRNRSGDPDLGVQIDGIYGTKTESAVRLFQKVLGISVDGIDGRVSRHALAGGMLAG
jgi:peptidoglycan hydrolase-like protein with peptidoglycan-binding domain